MCLCVSKLGYLLDKDVEELMLVTPIGSFVTNLQVGLNWLFARVEFSGRAGIGREGFAIDDGKMNGKVGSESKDPTSKDGRVGHPPERLGSTSKRGCATGRANAMKILQLSERCMYLPACVRHQTVFKANVT